MIQFDLLRLGKATRISIADDVRTDLELDKIVAVASNGDRLIAETWMNVLLLGETYEEDVRYRQDAVKDALAHRETVLKMYSISGEVLDRLRREVFFFRTDDPAVVVHEASRGIEIFADALEELITLLRSTPRFSSKAFSDLMESLFANIDEKFIFSAREVAKIFSFDQGIDFSVKLGKYNSLIDPILLMPKEKGSLLSKIFSVGKEYTYKLDPRDEAGAQILYDIERWVLSQVASTILKAYNHIKEFFEELRRQLSFYVGAMNLNDFFDKLGLPRTYAEFEQGRFSFENLHCLSLSISRSGKTVPYSLEIQKDGAFAVLISGANRGGKTTFIKAVGQALLLARSGLFVPAESFYIPNPGAVYTHFLREEERTLSYGKFEEEVKRFRGFVGSLKKGDFVIMDESFSTTNQLEASVVAENVVSALIDSGISVFYVTFLQDFIYKFVTHYGDKIVLLVPERLEDGTRTYRLMRGSLQPGYAMDLWKKLHNSG